MKNNRFRLEKSQDLPDWWVLTDTENLIVCKFEEHKFNETQRVSVLEDSKFASDANCANKLAHIMAEMGNYMFSHWYSIAMPTPVFEFRQDDENDRLLLIRNKFPKFTMEIQDVCDLKQLSDVLRAGGEFASKYNQIYDRNKG